MTRNLMRIVLAGKGMQSFYADITENGVIKKKKPITNYKGILVDERECIDISEESNNKIIIDYVDGDIKGVFRLVTRDEKKFVEPFHGLIVLIWFEKKKNGKKCNFLWGNIMKNDYRYAKFSSFGFEDKLVFVICDFLFSNLKNLLAPSVAERLNLVKGKSETEDEQVLSVEG